MGVFKFFDVQNLKYVRVFEVQNELGKGNWGREVLIVQEGF